MARHTTRPWPGSEADLDAEAAPLAALERDYGESMPSGGLWAGLILSVTSLVALGLGGIGEVAGAGPVRAGGLVLFCMIGLGSAPWALRRAMAPALRILLTFVTGFGGLVIMTTAMVNLHWWHPTLTFAILSVPAVLAHLGGLAGGFTALGTSGLRRAWLRVRDAAKIGSRPRESLIAGLTVAGITLCVAGMLLHRGVQPVRWGYPAQVGALWLTGLSLLVVAVVAAPRSAPRSLAFPVLAILVILTLTPSVLYGMPRSQSAAKHVDLVAQIRSAHRLNTTVGVYNGWPGMFGAAAWICDVAGIRDAMALATYWPPLIVLFRAAALRHLAQRLLGDVRAAWAVVLLAFLADPLGYDYFSPQSVGLVLGLSLFALAVSTERDAIRLPLMFFGGVAITFAHQLSPFIVGGVLAVFVFGRQLRPWWAPVTVIGPALAWTLDHTAALQSHLSLGDIGRLSNFSAPKTPVGNGLARDALVGDSVRALMLGLFVLIVAAAVTAIRTRRRKATWVWLVSAGVGLVFVAINRYGNEGIFRAIIFGVPWLAILAAVVLVVRRGPGRLARVPFALASVSLVFTYLIGGYALDQVNVIRKSDLAAYQYFKAQDTGPNAPKSYMLQIGAGDLPDYVPAVGAAHTQLQLAQLPALQLADESLDNPTKYERDITAAYVQYTGNPNRTALFVIWSVTDLRYSQLYGVESPAQYRALLAAFERSSNWTTVFQQDGTVVLRYRPPSTASGTGVSSAASIGP